MIYIEVAATVATSFVTKVADAKQRTAFFSNIGRQADVCADIEGGLWQLRGSLENINKAHELLYTIHQLLEAEETSTNEEPQKSASGGKEVDCCDLDLHSEMEIKLQSDTEDEVVKIEVADGGKGHPNVKAILLPERSAESKLTRFVKHKRKGKPRKLKSLIDNKSSEESRTEKIKQDDREELLTHSESNENKKPRLKIRLKKKTDCGIKLSLKNKIVKQDKDFNCPECDKRFSTSSNLHRHLKISHEGKRFECGHCSKNFTCKDSLDRHVKVVHEGLRCNGCLTLCVSISELETHMEACDQTKSKPQCPHCDKTYSCASNLNKHIKVAHDQWKYPCEFCNKLYKSKDTLIDHQRVLHAIFKCYKCQAIFDTDEAFVSHLLEKHSDEKTRMEVERKEKARVIILKKVKRIRDPVHCDRCGKVFSSQSNLGKHIRIVHEKMRFTCNGCDKSFSCKEQLARHKMIVHEGIQYTCSLCAESFDHRVILIKHQQLVHKQVIMDQCYQCEICGKSFLYECNLGRHKKRDHEGIRFPCDKCDREFKSKQRLQEHILAEHEGRRYVCETCPKMFRSKHKLRGHETSAHTSHKPYCCVLCKSMFSSRSTLKYHMQRTHKEHKSNKTPPKGKVVHQPARQDQTVSEQWINLQVESQNDISVAHMAIPKQLALQEHIPSTVQSISDSFSSMLSQQQTISSLSKSTVPPPLLCVQQVVTPTTDPHTLTLQGPDGPIVFHVKSDGINTMVTEQTIEPVGGPSLEQDLAAHLHSTAMQVPTSEVPQQHQIQLQNALQQMVDLQRQPIMTQQAAQEQHERLQQQLQHLQQQLQLQQQQQQLQLQIPQVVTEQEIVQNPTQPITLAIPQLQMEGLKLLPQLIAPGLSHHVSVIPPPPSDAGHVATIGLSQMLPQTLPHIPSATNFMDHYYASPAPNGLEARSQKNT